ncbi:hypothetical protein QBC44DRAFT_139371 [Cladorrhinum sp. PSN332]|nr:hypothetical protein QBC44DRAFT_139371 [Cladorrhinum sp. PSN332]
MPPRLRCTAVRGLGSAIKSSNSRIATRSAALLVPSPQTSRQYATAATVPFGLPDDYVPPTKPPTARPADTRKSQLLRSYTSLLRTTPLMLIFQHNNLTAVEWAAVRRELRVALREVAAPGTDSEEISNKTQIQILQTRIFDVALKTVEFYDASKVVPTTVSAINGDKIQVVHNHDLSKAAWKAVKEATESGAPEMSTYSQLEPLLVGPLAALTLPAVSPQHLAAALKILSPSPPKFPAPSRKKYPGYYDMHMQNGLQKLLLIGGRIEDKAFDLEGVRWVGGIENGLDGLRAQVVHMLQSAGMGLVNTLEGAGKSLWLTMESRRSVLEEEQNGGKEGEKKEE